MYLYMTTGDEVEPLNDSFAIRKILKDNQYKAVLSKSKTRVHVIGKSLRGIYYACRRTSRSIACKGLEWRAKSQVGPDWALLVSSKR